MGEESEGDPGGGLLPGGAGGDVLPPGEQVGAGGDEARLGGFHEVVGVWDVVQVHQGELSARQVLALRQPGLVHVQHLPQLHGLRLHHGHVGGAAQHRLDQGLVHQPRDGRPELLRLHLQPQIHRRPLRRGAAGEQQVRPRLRVLGGDVAVNRARLWRSDGNKVSHHAAMETVFLFYFVLFTYIFSFPKTPLKRNPRY